MYAPDDDYYDMTVGLEGINGEKRFLELSPTTTSSPKDLCQSLSVSVWMLCQLPIPSSQRSRPRRLNWLNEI
jgi:hypothetical protein